MNAAPIYANVAGSPFRLGQPVRVVGSRDETFQRARQGRMGIVSYFEYHCGCGQTYPKDPMVGVRFRDGTVEEFWKEELYCDRSKKGMVRNQRKR